MVVNYQNCYLTLSFLCVNCKLKDVYQKTNLIDDSCLFNLITVVVWLEGTFLWQAQVLGLVL